MTAQALLSVLEKVRPTASGEWVARCPAHNDRSPSLAIKEAADGRVLVHCFAGCGVSEVLAAVGLSFADIMPESLGPVEGLKRMPWNPRTVLEAIGNNALIMALMAIDFGHGEPLTVEDKDKIVELAGEIQEAISYARR